MIHDKTFLTTIEIVPNPIIIKNGNDILVANKYFLEFFDYKDLKEFLSYHSCISELFVQHKDYFSLSLIDKDTLWTDYIYYNNNNNNTEVSILDKNGNPTIFEITLNLLPDYNDYYIVVFTNITAIQNEKKLLEKMAYTDPLTNIYNRQMFHKMLQREKENKKRHGDALSLIMLDIDHFKAVNDTYGHDIGDKVLITLTKLITKNLRKNDIFARWGGEEFMILLPRTNSDIAYQKAQELKAVIEKYSDNIIPSITVSLGVTEILDTDKEQSCFKRVDEALYGAKIKRNDVVKLGVLEISCQSDKILSRSDNERRNRV